MKVFIFAFVVIFLAGFLDQVNTMRSPKTLRPVHKCFGDDDCQRMCDGLCTPGALIGCCTEHVCSCQVP